MAFQQKYVKFFIIVAEKLVQLLIIYTNCVIFDKITLIFYTVRANILSNRTFGKKWYDILNANGGDKNGTDRAC